MDEQISGAIRARRIVESTYRGHLRIGEPHVYGQHAGVDQLLLFQTDGGSSSGGLPQWRRVDLDGVTGLVVRQDTFPGSRPTLTGQHRGWDHVYEKVD